MTTIINEVKGKGIVIKGDNIDTDRIIPARFLKELTFEKLGESAFVDERTQFKEKGLIHPLDDPKFCNGSILVVNTNFGCGSSREAAPQALFRYGIRAIIGVSFGDIFFSSSVAIGMPCVYVTEDEAKQIQFLSESGGVEITVNIQDSTVSVGNQSFKCVINDGVKKQFISGTWDALVDLGQHSNEIQKVYHSLPYTSWGAPENKTNQQQKYA